jgi:predicted dehydrogenase
MRKYRITIIGLGHISSYHLRAISCLRNRLELIAFSDNNPKMLNNFIESYNIPFYKNYNEMILNEKFDIVIISTSTNTHYEIAKNIIPKSPCVIIEKPIALVENELEELLILGEKHNCKVITAFHASFAKDVIWFKENYKTKLKAKLGNIINFKCEFFDPYIIEGVLQGSSESLSGSWIDSGINAFSVLHSILDIDDIYVEESCFSQLPKRKEINTSSIIYLRYKEHSVNFYGKGMIHTNWNLKRNYKTTHLYFENPGYKIELNHSEQKVILTRSNNTKEILVAFSNTDNRLFNHYKGVFSNAVELLDRNSSNKDFSIKVHQSFYMV